MINKSLISIIMPAYNAEKYIKTAIESVISQSYASWELIIIDDFSKDSTKEIINAYIEKDNRIKKIVNSVNKGAAASRNIAIKKASGSWIAFLDSDDYWEKSKLEKQIEYMKKNNYNFTFTNTKFINDDGIEFDKNFTVPESVNFKNLRKHNVIACSSVIINKESITYDFIEKENIHEDYFLWLKILQNGNSAYGLNDELLIYRLSKSSKSGNKFKTVFMTYNVFREINYSVFKSLLFTALHSINAYLKKHKYLKVS